MTQIVKSLILRGLLQHKPTVYCVKRTGGAAVCSRLAPTVLRHVCSADAAKTLYSPEEEGAALWKLVG